MRERIIFCDKQIIIYVKSTQLFSTNSKIFNELKIGSHKQLNEMDQNFHLELSNKQIFEGMPANIKRDVPNSHNTLVSKHFLLLVEYKKNLFTFNFIFLIGCRRLM